MYGFAARRPVEHHNKRAAFRGILGQLNARDDRHALFSVSGDELYVPALEKGRLLVSAVIAIGVEYGVGIAGHAGRYALFKVYIPPLRLRGACAGLDPVLRHLPVEGFLVGHLQRQSL